VHGLPKQLLNDTILIYQNVLPLVRIADVCLGIDSELGKNADELGPQDIRVGEERAVANGLVGEFETVGKVRKRSELIIKTYKTVVYFM